MIMLFAFIAGYLVGSLAMALLIGLTRAASQADEPASRRRQDKARK
jgi:hypothetical protein